MTNRRPHDERIPLDASNGSSNGQQPAMDWEMDDFDMEEELDPMLEMQIELPLCGENFINGEPRVTVDYFGFSPSTRDAIVAQLHELRDMVFDYGADLPRFLLFEGPSARGGYESQDLIAIVSVRDREVRLETARPGIADPMRRTVESALGGRVRHLRRRSENPLGDLLA